MEKFHRPCQMWLAEVPLKSLILTEMVMVVEVDEVEEEIKCWMWWKNLTEQEDQRSEALSK